MALSDLQERFLEVLFDKGIDGDIKKAAKAAGYSNPDKNAWRIARALKDQIIECTIIDFFFKRCCSEIEFYT